MESIDTDLLEFLRRHPLDVDMNQIYVTAKTASYCIKFTSSACAILNHNIWRNKFLWPENHFIPINLLIQIDQMENVPPNFVPILQADLHNLP